MLLKTSLVGRRGVHPDPRATSHALAGKRKPVTAEDGEQFYVCDAIVPDQGPNYILAKRLQHWRAILARAAGCKASSNIAPSTATVSVVSAEACSLCAINLMADTSPRKYCR